MSGYDTTQAKIRRYFESQPGRRGKDVPTHIYDAIYPVANGISQTIWGRRPTGEQIAYLHRNGAHTPEKVHAAFNELPHPHAPNVTVGDYPVYAKAHQTYEEHRR